MAILEKCASLLPFKAEAFPDLKQSEKTSKVTFGRDSKTMPMTPKGTVVLVITNPLGVVLVSSTLFKGVGKSATFLISWAIPANRFSSNIFGVFGIHSV